MSNGYVVPVDLVTRIENLEDEGKNLEAKIDIVRSANYDVRHVNRYLTQLRAHLVELEVDTQGALDVIDGALHNIVIKLEKALP